MQKHRVVITGLGCVTSAGLGQNAFWSALQRNEPLFDKITRFAPRTGEPIRAGQVADFQPERWMPRALTRQTDISTQFTFASARLALEDAALELAQAERLRVGVMLGHSFGGMAYAEQHLYNQWVRGPEEVGPYQSIAWFYAAAMGQLSIHLGIKGYSKVFVADRCSGMHALGHALRVLQRGGADVMLAGGLEAPLSPFMHRTIASAGQVSRTTYEPFSGKGTGFVLGEGACVLVLETLEHAKRRGARVYAEIAGYSMTTDTQAGRELPSLRALHRAQQLALAEIRPGALPDHIVADGAAHAQSDLDEFYALQRLFEQGWGECKVSVPKAIVGELYGGGAPLQVLAAARSVYEQHCLPLSASPSGSVYVPHVRRPVPQALRTVLVNARGLGGMSACLVLESVERADEHMDEGANVWKS